MNTEYSKPSAIRSLVESRGPIGASSVRASKASRMPDAVRAYLILQSIESAFSGPPARPRRNRGAANAEPPAGHGALPPSVLASFLFPAPLPFYSISPLFVRVVRAQVRRSDRVAFEPSMSTLRAIRRPEDSILRRKSGVGRAVAKRVTFPPQARANWNNPSLPEATASASRPR